MATPLGYKKCYFLAPTRNYAPDNRIRLGSIISSASVPDEPINQTAFPIEPAAVDTLTETGWSLTHSQLREASAGIWASFLQLIIGLGGDAGFSSLTNDSETLSCERVVTSEFMPTKAFVEACVNSADVSSHLIEHKHSFLFASRPKPIYMITGIKVAHNASHVYEVARERKVYLHLGIDGTSAGVPLSAGPDGSIARGSTQGGAAAAVNAFVLGFRLRQINVRAKDNIEHKGFTDGAVFDKDDTGQDRKEVEKIDLEVEGLAEDDARGSNFKKQEFIVQDGAEDQWFACVNPT